MDEHEDQKRHGNELARLTDRIVISTNPFGRNISGEKAYRRAERIVLALHLLTNHIPLDEPVRASARRSGLALLSSLLSLRGGLRVQHSPRISSAYSLIRALISDLYILSISGFVSDQNASAVIGALDEVGNLLHVSQRSQLSEHISLTRDDFITQGREEKAWQRDTLKNRQRISDISDKSVKDITSVTDRAKKTVSVVNSGKGHARSEAILHVLRASGALGIKDIWDHLPEYSEKMIQRELATLIAKRQVTKTGKKRWSKYTLVSDQ